jgi:hypothetical protein
VPSRLTIHGTSITYAHREFFFCSIADHNPSTPALTPALTCPMPLLARSLSSVAICFPCAMGSSGHRLFISAFPLLLLFLASLALLCRHPLLHQGFLWSSPIYFSGLSRSPLSLPCTKGSSGHHLFISAFPLLLLFLASLALLCRHPLLHQGFLWSSPIYFGILSPLALCFALSPSSFSPLTLARHLLLSVSLPSPRCYASLSVVRLGR